VASSGRSSARVTSPVAAGHARTSRRRLRPDAEIEHSSAVSCNGLHTVAHRRLPQRLGSVAGDMLDEACGAIAIASLWLRRL
jgi:mRNA-degrading endonuclease toxin of MazEF toxin-antitoxin module